MECFGSELSVFNMISTVFRVHHVFVNRFLFEMNCTDANDPPTGTSPEPREIREATHKSPLGSIMFNQICFFCFLFLKFICAFKSDADPVARYSFLSTQIALHEGTISGASAKSD
jgi:hypothetical protein